MNMLFLHRAFMWLGVLLCAVTVVAQQLQIQPAEDKARFTRNMGQWDDQVEYKLRFNFGDLYLENNALAFSLLDAEVLDEVLGHHHEGHPGHLSAGTTTIPGHAFKIRFKDAQPIPALSGDERFTYYENYYLGQDPTKWASNVPLYGKVKYGELYPGIDMAIYGTENALKYDFLVAAGANPAQIALEFEGVDELYLKDGQLHYVTSVSHIYEEQPIAYQMIDGEQVPVVCNFKLKKNTVSFDLPNGYDNRYPLVIDPTLIFSSYTGSTTDNWGYTATYDNDGNLYGGGIFFRQAGYPATPGAFQTFFAGGNPGVFTTSYACDIGISKFSADGSTLLYSTYLGGSGNEAPHSLVVNNQNELIVYGTTSSIDFPLNTATAAQGVMAGGSTVTVTNVVEFTNGTDIFITKFNPTGTTLVGSTYMGGSGNDGLNLADSLQYNYADHARGEVVVDENNYVYVASSTRSGDFPVSANAAQTNLSGIQDACIFKLSPDLDTLIWSTYYGGTNDDAGYSLKATEDNEVIFCGGTKSGNIPGRANGLNNTYQGGITDGYVAKLNATGTTVMNATFLGTPFYDQAYILVLDFNGDVYVYGQTLGDYPVTPGIYVDSSGKQFIHKLNDDLQTDFFSTVFGAGRPTIDISPTALLVDICDNIYISGWGGQVNTGSGFGNRLGNTFGMRVSADASQPTTDGSDFYFLVLAKDADSLVFATYFGGVGPNGEHVDGGTSRFDDEGIIYQAVCASCGGTNIFPTTPGAYAEVSGQNVFGGNCNLGVIKYAFELATLDVDVTVTPAADGCVPLFLQFNPNGVNVKKYFWDLGNGQTDTTEFPIVLYSDTGTYNVMVVGYDSTTCSGLVLIDTSYVQVVVRDDSLSVDFTANIIDDCDSFVVDFTNLSVNRGPAPTNYLWDFGDSRTSTSVSPRHVYQNPGTYTVKLVVEAPGSCNMRDSATQTFTFLPRQEVSFTLNDTVDCAPFLADFTNTSVPGTVQTYAWDFGDGSLIDTSANPQHLYNNAGVYQVVLTATDTGACNPVETDTATVTVVDDSVFAGFTYQIVSVCDSFVVAFTNTSTNATQFFWDFGDGDTSLQANPVHEFDTAGTFTIRLIVDGQLTCNQIDSAASVVSFTPRQVVDFTLSDTIDCAPSTITFINNSAAATIQTFAWDFGDGSPVSTVQSPTHTYPNAGVYTVTLTGTDLDACNPVIVDTAVVTVVDDSLVADFVAQVIADCDSFVVAFTNTSLDAGSYLWDFGDGDSSTLQNPIHRFNSTGTFTVTLWVMDEFGCGKMDSATADFTFLPQQIADLAASSISGCIPLQVEFINRSTGTPAQNITWDFGDGSPLGTADTLTHTYATAGQFTVVLTSTDTNACNPLDADTVIVFVSDSFLTAAFTAQILVDNCDSLTVAFTDQSVNATNWQWSFGDGSVSSLQNPTHTYTATGSYQVMLVASNNGTCNPTDTAIANYLKKPPVEALFATPNGCRPINRTLRNNSTNATTYQWTLNGDDFSTEEEPLLYLDTMGSYSLTLTATNPQTCNVTDDYTVTFEVYDLPTAFFTTDSSSYPIFEEIQFTNQSTNPALYEWEFGDGEVSKEENPRHRYGVEGSYQPCLTVTDLKNCEAIYCEDLDITFRGVIGVANAFSPNGDQNNDILYVKGYGVAEMEFKVYNRWGELVFESYSLTDGWDGTYKGKKQEKEVYVYTLSAIFVDGTSTELLTGNISLLR